MSKTAAWLMILVAAVLFAAGMIALPDTLIVQVGSGGGAQTFMPKAAVTIGFAAMYLSGVKKAAAAQSGNKGLIGAAVGVPALDFVFNL